MPRIPHGGTIPIEVVKAELTAVRAAIADSPVLSVTMPPVGNLGDFDYLFLSQQGDEDLLPGLSESPQILENLNALGLAMRDAGDESGDSNIPAIYTYFGQFVDHDITLETASADLDELFSPTLAPLSPEEVRDTISNLRTATLDLDSVYGVPAPRSADGQKLVVGKVTRLFGTKAPALRPDRAKDDFNDVPREPRSADASHDRAALIGDPRNDENTIISQLHTAFLLAHNQLVDRNHTFEQARTLLRQHYQWVVLHDFLKKIVDPDIVNDLIARGGNRFYKPNPANFYLPLEYAVAAYRFGHSMVRAAYDFNLNFNFSGEEGTRPATLGQLFVFTRLSGGGGALGGFDTLPDNWIIEWENVLEGGNSARRIDTKLVEPLRGLDFTTPPTPRSSLAVRNLRRGYLLRMPTGQAVAKAMGLTPLTPAELKNAVNDATQVEILGRNNDELATRTPLWYYILAEAAAGGGLKLGPVGGTIVAEVLIELVRRSEDSILQVPGWKPSLPSIGEDFILEDILVLAGVHTRNPVGEAVPAD